MKSFKNTVQQIMKDKGITIYELIQTDQLSRNTIREIVNDPFKSFSLNTAEILAELLDCKISDLFIDDWKTLYFEERSKTAPSWEREHTFSPDNLKEMDRLFSQIGIHCTFEPYGDFSCLNINNAYRPSPYHINMNMRIENKGESTQLTIVDFYFCANKILFPEEKIKEHLIYLIELYAKKTGFQEILFYIVNDFSIHSGSIYESGLDIAADYSYTQGIKKQHFIKQGYKNIAVDNLNIYLSFYKEFKRP